MKITRFQKIKQHRIFRDFSWPGTSLPDFARFNLIYGWNGAGKTTLSNLFRHLQRRDVLVEGEVGVAIDDGRTVLGTEFPTAALPNIRVFNRDTVDRSIFEVPGKELPPVYYLGEDSAKAQAEIEKLKQDKNTASINVGSLQRAYSDKLKDVEQFEAAQAKAIKNLLTGPGSAYNNYNAGDFRAAANGLLKQVSSAPLSEPERENLLATARGTAMAVVLKPEAFFPNITELNLRVQGILQCSLVSNVIEELQNAPELAQWVASGLVLHRGHAEADASPICHFCQQLLPDWRLEQLEDHFNDQYASVQKEIAELLDEVSLARAQMKAVTFPDKGLLYSELREPFSASVERYTKHQHLTDSVFQAIERALLAKQREPFKKMDLMGFMLSGAPEQERSGLMKFFEGLLLVSSNFAAVQVGDGFAAACGLIDQHNDKTSKFSDQQRNARDALALESVLDVLNAYRAKLDARETAKREKEAAEAVGVAITKQIEGLERSNRRHHLAAEELTRDMASYLGRDELRFETRDTGYVITRNGLPAQHLSEGERTAIAFLHFLKSLQDKDFDLKNGIVVIDDPVSSLDANSLYCAFGFMKSRILEARQVFVLTHNFTFFRQVKNWFDHVGKKHSRFYMLRGVATPQGRGAAIQALDEMLMQYESEYHHMFKLVQEASQAAADASMSQFYALPNMARRLLEAVLAFKQPGKTGELYQQIKDIRFDEAKKARILRFTNTYSHHGLMPEPTHDHSVLLETPEALRDVLALVEHLDKEHFDSMSALCAAVVAEAA